MNEVNKINTGNKKELRRKIEVQSDIGRGKGVQVVMVMFLKRVLSI